MSKSDTPLRKPNPGVPMEQELHDQIKALADERSCSFAAAARYLLIQGLKAHDKTRAVAA